ncbi:hypothetical protein BV898_01211 [Hypsibius exemplaris]|uniref:C-type lectin domain-containing protein n=1 Tax=Hypsibius exemplaris TaxID=2072580 RepID=A0A1W0XBW9_HYPEX|nr:hypothetical protein BV898_01211 [Hypsibius exemplaris]
MRAASCLILAFSGSLLLRRTGADSQWVCPYGFTDPCETDVGKCYWKIDIPYIDQNQASSHCAGLISMGVDARLATIRSQGEQECLVKFMPSLLPDYFKRITTPFWLGLRKANATSVWKWQDGTNLHDGFMGWDLRAPNAPDTKFCAKMETMGGWVDYACDFKQELTFTDTAGTYNPRLSKSMVICETAKIMANQQTTTPRPENCPPCACQAADAVIVTCSKGRLTYPPSDDPMATRAEFNGDQSIKCRRLLSDLHQWVHHEAGLDSLSRLTGAGPIAVNCRGNRVIELSDTDTMGSEATSLSVEIAPTVECREFFSSFVNQLRILDP